MKEIINKSDAFYVYIASKKTTYYIGNKKELITYLAKGYRKYFYCNGITNTYFENINASGVDSYDEFTEKIEYKYDEFDELITIKTKVKIKIPKEYTFFDGLDRIIDVRIYQKEAEKEYYELNKEKKDYYSLKEKRKDNHKPGDIFVVSRYRGPQVSYKFRRESVPYIHKLKYSKYHRIPKLGALRKEQHNPEVSEYLRKKRKNIETSGWDYYRSKNQKSWKKQSKCRHQWEKNLKK